MFLSYVSTTLINYEKMSFTPSVNYFYRLFLKTKNHAKLIQQTTAAFTNCILMYIGLDVTAEKLISRLIWCISTKKMWKTVNVKQGGMVV